MLAQTEVFVFQEVHVMVNKEPRSHTYEESTLLLIYIPSGFENFMHVYNLC